MTRKKKKKTRRKQIDESPRQLPPEVSAVDRAAPFIVGFAYFVLVLTTVSFYDVYEFDPDEGNNLIKALMLNQGYSFLDEIWSDQPPLYTYLLLVVFKLFGWEVVYGRILTVIFAAVILGTIYDTLRRSYDHAAALAAVVLLVFSYSFVTLSVSVMIGLPSVAFAALSLWALVYWRLNDRPHLLVLSGGMMGCSLATKLFTGFLVPVFSVSVVLWAVMAGGEHKWRSVMRSSALWGVGFVVAVVVCLGPVLLSDQLSQLYDPHLRLIADNPFPGRPLMTFLEREPELYSLAALGVVCGLLRRRAAAGLYALWLMCALVSLYLHFPVWYHHVLLIAIPGCALAGIALSSLFGFVLGKFGVEKPAWTLLATAISTVVVLVMLDATSEKSLAEMFEPRHFSNDERDYKTELVLKQYLTEKPKMISARPMYVFRTLSLMPPDLSVSSVKRFLAGLFTAEQVKQHIESFQPDQVVLTSRWGRSVRREIRESLGYNYKRVYQDRENGDVQVYVRSTLVK
ncbi:MAG: glycosyltransferase family 39 protein [Deltaproteobacteria bacterium]|nr:glycosyltransferase family 39 protein [Deltaproteobacteria bacterium]